VSGIQRPNLLRRPLIEIQLSRSRFAVTRVLGRLMLAMTKFKKLTFVLSGLGLVVVLFGTLLLSQGSTRLGEIGGSVHFGGQLLTLIALSSFLCLSLVERRRRQLGDCRSAGSVPFREPGSLMITAARITSILLLILGALTLIASGLLILGGLLRFAWGVGFLGILGVYGLVLGTMTLASGLALWLIADTAQHTTVLLLRSSRDDLARGQKVRTPASSPKEDGEEGSPDRRFQNRL